MANAKTMIRSRNQLATAYAPESFFTFEGGVGACISRSTAGELAALEPPTRDQILDRINEFGMAWLQAARRVRDGQPDKPQVLPVQCVDRKLLDDTEQNFQMPPGEALYLCKPSHMEYTPAPLTFVCRSCGLFKDFASLHDLRNAIPHLTPDACPHPRGPQGTCSWEQLDVIFVHWSGNWAPAAPGQWDWKPGGAYLRRSQCPCGSFDFTLNRNNAQIGQWSFACARCKEVLSPRWLQNDSDTLDMLRTPVGQGRLAGPTEVRMEVTPYRASNAFYVQSDLFIDFKEGGRLLLTRLRPGHEEQLVGFIAATYGFDGTPITDADVEAACADKPECKDDLDRYRSAVQTLNQLPDLLIRADATMRPIIEMALRTARDSRQQVLTSLQTRNILVPKVTLPESIAGGIRHRSLTWASRFDPYRLAIEHATLKETRLDVETTVAGKKPYVSFKRLDTDLSAESKEETEALQRSARDRLDLLGLADMGLIREFELCRFSFGYSRMDGGPQLIDKRDMNMPVRLNLFPSIKHDDKSKHPVYIVQQANQAIYARLDERRMLAWLRSLDCDDMFTLRNGERVGAGILEVAKPMDRFLEGLPEGRSPRAYFYLYTLLHSCSHLLMRQVSEYSGLDLGSLGEYIFPADCAFVVYRNGTTMDLGNLSAMWRNSGIAMLSSLLSPRAAQCGTGSLCTQRGGSCPDCMMVPETSCIASNKLLSRSVLRSIGGRPRFDTREKRTVVGYLESTLVA
jgi:hypothetical protein